MNDAGNKNYIRGAEPFISEDAEPSSLKEAMGILEELAMVFFQEDPEFQTTGGYPDKSKSDPAIPKVQSNDFETMYRILAEQIPAVVFLAYLDKGFGQAYVSPHIETVLGFSQQEWLNDPVRWFKQLIPKIRIVGASKPPRCFSGAGRCNRLIESWRVTGTWFGSSATREWFVTMMAGPGWCTGSLLTLRSLKNLRRRSRATWRKSIGWSSSSRRRKKWKASARWPGESLTTSITS